MENPYNVKPLIYTHVGQAPLPLKEATSNVMRANKGKDTKPELVFRKCIYKKGVRGYRLHNKKIIGQPDISFPKKKIAVFINGCFWHRCPKCNLPLPKTHTDYWDAKLTRNQERDVNNIITLEKDGWKVLTIWECETKENIEECFYKLELLFGIGFQDIKT